MIKGRFSGKREAAFCVLLLLKKLQFLFAWALL